MNEPIIDFFDDIPSKEEKIEVSFIDFVFQFGGECICWELKDSWHLVRFLLCYFLLKIIIESSIEMRWKMESQ